MNPYELSVSVAAIANAIASKLTDDQLQIAAAAFTQLGDTLNTIQIQRSILKSKKDSEKSESQQQSSADKSQPDSESQSANKQ